MPNLPHPQLDLAGTIRPGLDILGNEIVIALKKRTRFPVNAPVYEAGLVISNPQIPLLEHVLTRIESCHAELGRYTFAAQEAFTAVDSIAPVIGRNTPDSPLHPMQTGVGDRIKEHYRQWINRACEEGQNTDSYGETVTSDVVALMAIIERVNLGKPVAESKYLAQPQAFIETAGEREGLLSLLVKKDREQQVLDIAADLATRYDLPAEHVVDIFQFMIATTIDIEVDYLRMRIHVSKDEL